MSKSRKYSLVIHNVFPGHDERWKTVTSSLQPSKYVLSLEPYPQDNTRYHLHIFIEFKNARSFKSVFQFYEQSKIGYVEDGCNENGSKYGRVQCDPMRGSFEQATAYLTEGLTKKTSKICGDVQVVTPVKNPCKECGTEGNPFIDQTYEDGTLWCRQCRYKQWLKENERCFSSDPTYYSRLKDTFGERYVYDILKISQEEMISHRRLLNKMLLYSTKCLQKETFDPVVLSQEL